MAELTEFFGVNAGDPALRKMQRVRLPAWTNRSPASVFDGFGSMIPQLGGGNRDLSMALSRELILHWSNKVYLLAQWMVLVRGLGKASISRDRTVRFVGDTLGEIGLYQGDSSDFNMLPMSAAHSNILPGLVYQQEGNPERILAGLGEGAIGRNMTVCLPKVVDEIDASVDGRTDSPTNLRGYALQLLTEVSHGKTVPTDALKMFVGRWHKNVCHKVKDAEAKAHASRSQSRLPYLRYLSDFLDQLVRKLEKDEVLSSRLFYGPLAVFSFTRADLGMEVWAKIYYRCSSTEGDVEFKLWQKGIELIAVQPGLQGRVSAYDPLLPLDLVVIELSIRDPRFSVMVESRPTTSNSKGVEDYSQLGADRLVEGRLKSYQVALFQLREWVRRGRPKPGLADTAKGELQRVVMSSNGNLDDIIESDKGISSNQMETYWQAHTESLRQGYARLVTEVQSLVEGVEDVWIAKIAEMTSKSTRTLPELVNQLATCVEGYQESTMRQSLTEALWPLRWEEEK